MRQRISPPAKDASDRKAWARAGRNADRLTLLAMCCLTLSIHQCTRGVEVAFPVRLPDPEAVRQALDQDLTRLGGYAPAGTARVLLETLVKFNLLTVSPRRSNTELEEALQAVKVTAQRCLEDDGQETLHKLCLWSLVRFEQDFKALLLLARAPKTALALFSGAQPPAEILTPFNKFAEIGGDFLLHAANAGLVRLSSREGIELTEGAAFFVRLAYKLRWANILPEVARPKAWLLSDFEREWYDIWVVERSRTASLPRKLAATVRLTRRDPNYRKHLAQGIVYYQKQKYAEAVSSFEKALEEHPDEELSKSFLDAAKRRAR